MASSRQRSVDAVSAMSNRFGLNFKDMLGIAKLESGLNPTNRTGSYKGLFQIDNKQFAKYGPEGGNIYNPEQNAMAAGQLFKAEGDAFTKKQGREPTGFDRYMVHQQGLAGYSAHLNNPEGPAYKNFKGASGWSDNRAQQAIWGNMTPEWKKQFPGGAASVSSQDFVGLWNQRAALAGIDGGNQGQPQPTPVQAQQQAADRQFGARSFDGIQQRLVPTQTITQPNTAMSGGPGDIAGETAINNAAAGVERFAAPGLTGGVGQATQAPSVPNSLSNFDALGNFTGGQSDPFSPPSGGPPGAAPNASRFATPGIAPSGSSFNPPQNPPMFQSAGYTAGGIGTDPRQAFSNPDPTQVSSSPNLGAPSGIDPTTRRASPPVSGWPDWAIRAFYHDGPEAFQQGRNNIPSRAPGDPPGPIPSTTDWMRQFSTFGDLFSGGAGGGGFGGDFGGGFSGSGFVGGFGGANLGGA